MEHLKIGGSHSQVLHEPQQQETSDTGDQAQRHRIQATLPTIRWRRLLQSEPLISSISCIRSTSFLPDISSSIIFRTTRQSTVVDALSQLVMVLMLPVHKSPRLQKAYFVNLSTFGG